MNAGYETCFAFVPMDGDSIVEAAELVARVVRLLDGGNSLEGEGFDRGQFRYAEALAHTLLDQLRTMQAARIPAPVKSVVRVQLRLTAAPVNDDAPTAASA